MDRRLYRPTFLQCPVCFNVQTIHRKTCSPREEGHLKYLWCHICKDTINHIEHKKEYSFDQRIIDFQRNIRLSGGSE